METTPLAKKEVPLFIIVIFAIGIKHGVNSNKSDCSN